jgi:L-ribulose-5-phosphate 3-epimerase
MQGRLSPPSDGRIQSFPTGTWRQEFHRAREAGLACIEWIYEAGSDAANPLRTEDGLREMQNLAKESGVGVWSICADYYMDRPLVTADGHPAADSVAHLQWLITRAAALGARYMVLPFVDVSSLASAEQVKALPRVLADAVRDAERLGVELHLETDLSPHRLVGLLERISSPAVRANYDIGNSASLGHDPREELTALGRWLGSVHVKDRRRGGRTVPLGSGSADFPTCFRLIVDAGFHGPYILQVARETGISEVALAQRNKQFVERHLSALVSADR